MAKKIVSLIFVVALFASTSFAQMQIQVSGKTAFITGKTVYVCTKYPDVITLSLINVPGGTSIIHWNELNKTGNSVQFRTDSIIGAKIYVRAFGAAPGYSLLGIDSLQVVFNSAPPVSTLSNVIACGTDSTTFTTAYAPNHTYQWYMNGAPIMTSAIVGSTTNTVKVPNTATFSGRNFYCLVTNNSTHCSDTAQTASKTGALLTVNPALNVSFADDAGASICKGVIITYSVINNGPNSISVTMVTGASYLTGSHSTVTITVPSGATGYYTLLIPDSDAVANFVPTYVIRDVVTNCYY